MTVDELKEALLGREYATPIRLGDHAVITSDPALFLRTQFIECDRWRGELIKCPAYLRLLKFYDVVNLEK